MLDSLDCAAATYFDFNTREATTYTPDWHPNTPGDADILMLLPALASVNEGYFFDGYEVHVSDLSPGYVGAPLSEKLFDYTWGDAFLRLRDGATRSIVNIARRIPFLPYRVRLVYGVDTAKLHGYMGTGRATYVGPAT